MRKPSANSCPECGSEEVKSHTTYTINAGEEREEYECQDCGSISATGVPHIAANASITAASAPRYNAITVSQR